MDSPPQEQRPPVQSRIDGFALRIWFFAVFSGIEFAQQFLRSGGAVEISRGQASRRRPRTGHCKISPRPSGAPDWFYLMVSGVPSGRLVYDVLPGVATARRGLTPG